MRSLGTATHDRAGIALFPGGVTSVKLNVSIASVGSFQLEISGPGAPKAAGATPVDAHDDWLFEAGPRPTPDLRLAPKANAAAEVLPREFPGVIFTSGRRSIAEQAHAMAPNVVANRQWIEQTYVASAERDELQRWVDAHPEATTAAEIEAGLLGVMSGWPQPRQRSFSRHITGDAFDVQPVDGDAGEQIKARMKTLPNVEKVLFREGGREISSQPDFLASMDGHLRERQHSRVGSESPVVRNSSHFSRTAAPLRRGCESVYQRAVDINVPWCP